MEKFNNIMEAVDYILENINSDEDVMDTNISDEPSDVVNDADLLEELNRIFTPVLVSQEYEKDINDAKQEAMSEAGVLTEKNVIAFDEETRMAQLVSVCALLIARKKNTENWQIFSKAAALKKASKLNIQQEEHNDAVALAQKYLVNVYTTNNSSVARNAANGLLPLTNKIDN